MILAYPSLSLEELADNLAALDYVVLDSFLDAAEIDKLIALFDHHREEDNFQAAGIGRAVKYQVNRQIRGDYIKWLDPDHALPAAVDLLERMHQLRTQLNRLLFLSMKDLECHLALYPPGTFYERHLDQFHNRNFRKLSFVIYLNRHWQASHSGELVLYKDGMAIGIPPLAGRMVIFRSDSVEHEVLTTSKSRLSITGWMLDRLVDWPVNV